MRFVDLTGKRFGRFTVIRRMSVLGEHDPHWLCQCSCGEEKVVIGRDLRRGTSQSCGCLRQEVATMNSTRHGDATKIIDGKRLCTKEYRAWCNMKQRCYNTKDKFFKDYGGRGIRVCKRWRDSYAHFLRDMERAPSPKHSIDRIDNDGNYTSENCRWATDKQQRRNQRPKSVHCSKL